MTDGGEESEEERVLVRDLLLKKGVVVKVSSEETDVKTAAEIWNQKNKLIGEHHINKLPHNRFLRHNVCQVQRTLRSRIHCFIIQPMSLSKLKAKKTKEKTRAVASGQTTP